MRGLISRRVHYFLRRLAGCKSGAYWRGKSSHIQRHSDGNPSPQLSQSVRTFSSVQPQYGLITCAFGLLEAIPRKPGGEMLGRHIYSETAQCHSHAAVLDLRLGCQLITEILEQTTRK